MRYRPIRRNSEYGRVYARGKSYVNPALVLYVLKTRGKKTRVGLTATKKIGHAVQRNRARRVMKAAIDEHLDYNIGGYDLVFVAVQAGQLADVLPILKANRSQYFIFVGNDPYAQEMLQAMQRPADKIAFGFQGTAGRREHDHVVSVYASAGMTVGGATAPLSGTFRIRLKTAFDGTKYKLTFYSDMDEWLKCHIAFILPVCYVCYACNGDLTRATKEQRRMIVDAAWECCEMLKAAGVPVNDAENTDRYREGTKQRKKTERMVYWMAQTVVGKWCISDHAMRAVSEMQYLDEAFAALRATTLVEMTAWDELRRSLPRKK